MLQSKSRRKLTGGKRTTKRKKRKHEMQRESILCKVSEEDRRKKMNVRGNRTKTRLRTTRKVNVTNREKGTTQTEEIKDVVENKANSHFVRRKALTKGTVVETENGKARITSRPGQNGHVNAVRIE